MSGSLALPPRWPPQCSCVVIESNFDPDEWLQAPGSIWLIGWEYHLLWSVERHFFFTIVASYEILSLFSIFVTPLFSMYIFELMQNAYTHIEDTCNYLALWIHLENLHSYFAFAKPLSHYIYRSYRILIGLFLIIEGITDFFQLRYYSKKFLHATPSAFLNGNSSKLCMLAYYHVNIFIS